MVQAYVDQKCMKASMVGKGTGWHRGVQDRVSGAAFGHVNPTPEIPGGDYWKPQEKQFRLGCTSY